MKTGDSNLTIAARLRLSMTAGAILVLLLIEQGCGQIPPPAPPYPLPLVVEAPVGSAYPGTRELMDAPSNDPALNNDRNGVEVRP
jgi:hypothetical protein